MNRRVVYIGGFGNGRSCAEGVASALEDYYENVEEPFTFSEAIKDPEKIRKAVERASVVTHSAGLLAIRGTWPESIQAFNPPLPTSRSRLVIRTLAKTTHLHTPGRGIKRGSDIKAVAQFDASSVAELAVHPVANLGNLGKISKFNAVKELMDAQEAYIPSELIYTDDDDYFKLSWLSEMTAKSANVRVTRLPGEHDELILRPAQTLAQYYSGSF